MDGVDAGTEEARATQLASIASPQRAVAVIGALLGSEVRFGPVATGPHDMATARASGPVGRIAARRVGPGQVVVTVPVELDLVVTIGRRDIPVEVDLAVRVGLVARWADDRRGVEVEVAPISPGDIDVETHTTGAGGVFLRRFADLEAEIRHHIGVYVSTLLASEDAVAATRLSVDS